MDEYLTLISKVTFGNPCPSNADIRNACGDELANKLEYQMGRIVTGVGEQQIYENINDVLRTYIEKNGKVIPAVTLSVLQHDICKAHDEKWIMKDRVTELYSDGEITSQKGGELYGLRTTFTFAKPLLDKYELELPISEGARSYAILESFEVAEKFRNRMILLSKL